MTGSLLRLLVVDLFFFYVRFSSNPFDSSFSKLKYRYKKRDIFVRVLMNRVRRKKGQGLRTFKGLTFVGTCQNIQVGFSEII